MEPIGLDPKVLLQSLADQGILSCVGVPDSTLEPLMQVLLRDSRFHNTIAVNECEAVSIAMGQFLGSGRPSLVYLQNSGFGKTIHPVTSLLSREICSIPVLLLIGWRGCPGAGHDEPQHVHMGRIMPTLLESIGIPFEVVSPDPSEASAAVRRAKQSLIAQSGPYALVVRPGLFTATSGTRPRGLAAALTRKRALELLIATLPKNTLYVSTTGKASRELYFIREALGQPHDSDLYVVGGMGCASSIAFGLAQKTRETQSDRIICIVDGDGAALMQLGTLATIGHYRPENILHVIVDNESYESTGGQPSVSPTVDFAEVAKACQYPWTRSCKTEAEFQNALQEALSARGPRLLAVKTASQSDPKLGRPSQSPMENAESFLRNVTKNPTDSR